MVIKITSVNAKYVFFTRLADLLIDEGYEIDYYDELTEKLEALGLHYLGNFTDENECITFYDKYFAPIIKYDIIPYRKLFSDNGVFKEDDLNGSEIIKRNAQTDYNRMDEVSPIDATIGRITTPSFKINNQTQGNSTDTHSKINDYKKIYNLVYNGLTWAEFVTNKFKRCIAEFNSMY